MAGAGIDSIDAGVNGISTATLKASFFTVTIGEQLRLIAIWVHFTSFSPCVG